MKWYGYWLKQLAIVYVVSTVLLIIIVLLSKTVVAADRYYPYHVVFIGLALGGPAYLIYKMRQRLRAPDQAWPGVGGLLLRAVFIWFVLLFLAGNLEALGPLADIEPNIARTAFVLWVALGVLVPIGYVITGVKARRRQPAAAEVPDRPEEASDDPPL